MKRNKICTTIYLVLGAALVVADMVTDCWVAVTWWHRPGYRFYARIAIGLLCVSAFLPVLLGLVVFVQEFLKKKYCEGLCGCCFLVFNLQVVLGTLVSLGNIWGLDKNPADYWGASSDVRNAKGTVLWKTFEFLFEACPQLFLQAYVATYGFYGPDSIGVQPVLAASIALSTFSIASGLANHWLANESLGGYYLGGIVFASMLIARVCTFVAVFVEFGALAWIAVVVVLLAHAGAINTIWWEAISEYKCVETTAWIPLAIVPLGSHRFGGENLDISQFWITFEYEAAVIANVLLSPLGKANFVLHVVGNCIMLRLVAVLSSRGDRPVVSGDCLLLFGVLPMAIGIAAYVAAFIIYSQEPQSAAEIVAQKVDESKDREGVMQQLEKSKVQAEAAATVA